MYVRWLFILLAALNLGAAGWLLFARTPSRATLPATDPGVPELQLVSEAAPAVRATAQGAPARAAAPRVAAAAAPLHAGLSAAETARAAPSASAASTVSGSSRGATGALRIAPAGSSVASGPVPPVLPAAPAALAASRAAALASSASASAVPPSPGASTASAVPPSPDASMASANPAAPQATASAAAIASAPAAPRQGATSAAPAAADTCTSLGPFTNEADMRAALRTLSPHIARIRHRESEVDHPHGYWVYLPSVATRADAQAEARALVAKGVRDYYVVGNTSDTPNAISLGVYNDAVNAQNRVDQVGKLGFAAKVRRRVDTEPVYWLDFAVAKGTTFRWQDWLPGRKDLATKPIDCF